ncbi:hypothetical protein Lser_V15G20198 [Lactuca serriola]
MMLPDQTCQRFTLSEIQSATQNFDEALVIGRGGFGKVYKCSKIGSMSNVAVKRLHSMSLQGANEFEAEVQVLSKLRHGNLLSLIGYCNEEKEMVLVYEFMPNGTLEDHLSSPDLSLSWLQLLKICVGAARGLDYLHMGTSTQHGVIHRDVKTSNILLDANFAAKISDFGLAKVGLIDRTHVSTAVKGTFGYMDPCYFYTGKLTTKSDVYAFGVVLFEVLSGRKAVDSTLDEDHWGLAGWVQHKIKEGKLNRIIDPRLIGQVSRKCLKEFAKVARYCLHTKPKQRLTMAEVVVKLESILSQETEIANSIVGEEGFIYKLRSLFTGKVHTGIKWTTDQTCRTFTYAELASATNDFMEEVISPTLNEAIYKGYAPTENGVGLAMYVRRIEILLYQTVELKRFNHHRFVKLLGYCSKKEELFCVYEFIHGKSLARYLYGEPGTTLLSWDARLNIAIGACEGLLYVHKKNQAAYSQFKTSHILVDTNFNARLSDFAFDTYVFHMDRYYAAPEWFRYRADRFDTSEETYDILHGLSPTDDFAMKNEIYAFGVVLLEMLTGMKVYDEERPVGKEDFVKWAIPLLADEVNLRMIMDPQLHQHNDFPPKGAFKLAQLLSTCLHPEKDKRPSMEDILQVLNHCYQKEIKTV